MTLWQIIRQQPVTLFWAVFVHVLVIVVISVSFKSSDKTITVAAKEKVIEAVAIDEAKINAEIQKLKKAEQRKKNRQQREINKSKQAKRERLKEEKRLRALKKKQKEQERLSREKNLKEKKRLAELEKKKKAEEQKLAQIALKRKLEQERLALEEQARKDKEEQRKKAIAAQKLKAQQTSEVNRYKVLIKREITRSWVIPPSYRKGMSCTISVRLIPSGDVVGMRILKSSGNSAFDRSVETAVQKASPLTVPKSSSGLFDYFREVEFVFDPNA